MYVCTEKAGVPDICSGETDLFNISCDIVVVTPTENEMVVSRTDVRVCVIADLITKYGNYSVCVVFLTSTLTYMHKICSKRV